MSLTYLNHNRQPDHPSSEPISRHCESVNKALLERFRCPEPIARYVRTGEPSHMPGYFRYGKNAVCFGRSYAGPVFSSAAATLADAKSASGITDPVPELPFDPDEVIDNLRLERYTLDRKRLSGRLATGPLIRSIYYFLRPLLSVESRRHLQRIALRDWRNRPFPHWPVDLTVENILEELLVAEMQANRLETVPFIWFWPHGHSSCAIMTHDVETETGRAFCSQLMDIDDSFGIKASFQIVPTKRYVVTNPYLETIRSRGFEVNVQDWNHDGHLYRERAEFLRRAWHINRFAKEQAAVGFRAGMLYRNVDWFDALDVAYDMSIPNVAHLDPQRGGCCTVFPYFIGNLLEIPVTTTQDYSLFHILGEYSTDLWQKQCAMIRNAHGLMSFIVHPDYLLERNAAATYNSLLALLASFREQHNTWIPLPGEVNDWWRSRSQMSIVRENGKLRIVGPDSNRARLGFARIENGRIVCALDEKGAGTSSLEQERNA